VAIDPQPANPDKDPEAAPVASSLAPVVSSNQFAFGAPGPAPAASSGRRPTLHESKKGAGSMPGFGVPRNSSDYAYQEHAIIPLFRGWISNRVTLAIGALGLLALFFWLAWPNPETSQLPSRIAATENPNTGLLESQSQATKTDLNSRVRESNGPGITGQQSANPSAGGAQGKVLQGPQNGGIASITDVVPFTNSASKLNTHAVNEADATTPYGASSGYDLPASPPDLSGMTPVPSSKVILQPVRAAVKAGVPLGKPIKVVKPEYPKSAQLRRIEGDVRFEIQVDATGKVQNVRRISGEPTLSDAAEQAVRQWLYPPFPDDGSARLAVTEVQFNFKLNPETRK
jgi:TonB family protein